jgi:hypothetical protein
MPAHKSNRILFFSELAYRPIPPTPDSDELAKNARIVLLHTPEAGPTIRWVAAGDMVSGYVIGLEA